jgi:hypothetical protein
MKDEEKMKFKSILKKEVIELPTSRLAHVLNIPYELSELIQSAIKKIKNIDFKNAEKIYNRRMKGVCK